MNKRRNLILNALLGNHTDWLNVNKKSRKLKITPVNIKNLLNENRVFDKFVLFDWWLCHDTIFTWPQFRIKLNRNRSTLCTTEFLLLHEKFSGPCLKTHHKIKLLNFLKNFQLKKEIKENKKKIYHESIGQVQNSGTLVIPWPHTNWKVSCIPYRVQ